MKIVTETTATEGLESLLGQNVTLFCMNYIYAGKLVGVDDVQVKLDDAKIVYETGAFTKRNGPMLNHFQMELGMFVLLLLKALAF